MLRALIALLKVLNLIPNNHMAVHKHLILPSGVQMNMQTKHPIIKKRMKELEENNIRAF